MLGDALSAAFFTMAGFPRVRLTAAEAVGFFGGALFFTALLGTFAEGPLAALVDAFDSVFRLVEVALAILPSCIMRQRKVLPLLQGHLWLKPGGERAGPVDGRYRGSGSKVCRTFNAVRNRS